LGIIVPMQSNLPVPSGGAIILTAAFVFMLTALVRNLVPRFRVAS